LPKSRLRIYTEERQEKWKENVQSCDTSAYVSAYVSAYASAYAISFIGLRIRFTFRFTFRFTCAGCDWNMDGESRMLP